MFSFPFPQKQKFPVGVLQQVGNSETPGSTAVTVVSKDASGNVTHARGTTVPGDEAGFAKSCLFVKTDAADGTAGLYENVGTTTSSDFNLIGSISSSEIADDAVTEAKVADTDGTGGLGIKKVAVAVYDFAVDGGTEGVITLTDTATLPDNAVVTDVTYDVITTLTSSSDAATIKLSVPTDGDLSTAIAISDAGNPWDAGAHFGSEITALPLKTTAARALQITTAGGQDITAGKVVFFVGYIVSQ